jgi:hypothetical protein
MALPWIAMGIGALMGGMQAKQSGGDFMKGALTGAALGGITGGLGGMATGTAAGTSAGGIFGFGTKMIPNMLAMSGIGMGTEMMGQQEANKAALEGRRRLFDEEEEERLRRLSEIAGYDVADSKNFLTPQSYFGVADGGIINTRQGFYNGGGAWADIPMEEGGPTMDPEIMQLPMGQEGSFESENEDFLELSGLTDEEMSELQSLQSLSIVTPEGDPNYERIQIRLQELMGRMKVADGGYIGRPKMFLGGIAALLGGAGILSKILGGRKKRGEALPMKKPILDKLPGRPHLPIDEIDEDDLPQIGPIGPWDRHPGLQLLNQARGGSIERPGYKDAGIVTEDESEWYDRVLNATPAFREGTGVDEEGFITMPGPDGEMIKVKPAFRGIGGYDEEENYAQGGIADLDMRGGGESIGPGTGTSDDVPAMLSDGEFVMTADAVSNLGGGDRMVGARRMYNMMNQLDPNSQSPGEMNVAGYG